MEIVGCRAEESAYPFRPAAMLFHGITGGHIQGIMEEMERRSKSADNRLAKGIQVNGRETVWFQNARAKFRRNLLRQETGVCDKVEGASLSAPASAESAALTPTGTSATLSDLTSPSLNVGASVTPNMDAHEPGSPPQTTLTNLF
ncbi:hypothetical protein FKM82_019950 [Ascaphus truei]